MVSPTPSDIVQMAQRIYKTRYFDRWTRGTSLSDERLRKVVTEIAGGLIDADLGGGIIKKRAAGGSHGKRGGYRLLIATNKRDRWFFVAGFQKNERDNITPRELTALQAYAAELLKLSPEQLDTYVTSKAIYEISENKG